MLALLALVFVAGGILSGVSQVSFLARSARAAGKIRKVEERTRTEMQTRKTSTGTERVPVDVAYREVECEFQLPEGPSVSFTYDEHGFTHVREGESVQVAFLSASPAESAQVLYWTRGLEAALGLMGFGLVLGGLAFWMIQGGD